jgi:hypothetical protein
LNKKRLTEAWYQYSIIQFDLEFYLTKDHFYGNMIKNLDDSLKSRRKDFLPFFIKKWSGISHSNRCTDAKCSFAINVDGNWKCFRLKCAFEDVHLISNEMNPIKIGCLETPMRGSYFCKNHSYIQEIVHFNVNGQKWPFDARAIKSEVKGRIGKNVKVKIHDYFENHSGNIYYLVTISESDDNPFWATENQIPLELIEEYNQKKPKVELSCLTKKTIKCVKKTRTQGILISAFNCGIICGFREIFGSESKKQVALFLMDVYMHFEKIPKYTIYDDACHLKKYVENLKSYKTKQNRSVFFASTTLVVDKLHIKNHVDQAYCLKFCDPEKYEDLNEIVTVRCEEINSWFSPFKNHLKYMNRERYIFFVFLMFNFYNEIKIA